MGLVMMTVAEKRELLAGVCVLLSLKEATSLKNSLHTRLKALEEEIWKRIEAGDATDDDDR